MVLDVIHYYNAPGNVDIGENLKKSMFTIITTSTFFLSNSIVTWEVNRGKLYICEIYSKFNDEAYQKSYVHQILEDDNKVFHDWINCYILVPGNLIPGFNKAEGNYLSIKIKSGRIEVIEYRLVLAEYD
ncbi:hypothetical protein [Chryseobacterium gleum]|uniref:hypothetical protein n=1 Tax=Chryseobacterium gleum TaxID=250 RepID=UPI0028986258|nr:hypothetical protein [Chryseobacterium gleum]